ncbi:MAG: PAAR domain-containing protein [Cyanobacteria bacterium J06633_8]
MGLGRPAARIGDLTTHLIPPLGLGIAKGSPNVIIGRRKAFRGIKKNKVGKLKKQKKNWDKSLNAANKAFDAAPEPISKAATLTAAIGVKTAAIAAMSAQIKKSAKGADLHLCLSPLPPKPPVPPSHGLGVVINGSKTVLINKQPATRMGDTILEAVGPGNKIITGCFTVLIGG